MNMIKIPHMMAYRAGREKIEKTLPLSTLAIMARE
jgi:hypothetical protein